MKKRAREIGGRLADILAERYQEPGEIGLILFDLGAWRGDLVQKGAPRESWDAILAHLFTQGGFGAWRALIEYLLTERGGPEELKAILNKITSLPHIQYNGRDPSSILTSWGAPRPYCTFERYHLCGRLSEGSPFGVVYRARLRDAVAEGASGEDWRVSEEVCLRVLNPTLFRARLEVEAFLREVQTLIGEPVAGLLPIQRVAAIEAAGHGTLCVVQTPLSRRGSLVNLLESPPRSGPPSQAQLLDWMRDVSLGLLWLEQARERPHPLLRMESLISLDGRLRVADQVFAFLPRAERLAARLVDPRGRPLVAPEQLEDPFQLLSTTPVFTLGKVFEAALRPMVEPEQGAARWDAVSWRQFYRGTERGLLDLISCMTIRDPWRRPRLGDVVDVLNTLLCESWGGAEIGGGPEVAPDPDPVPSTSPPNPPPQDEPTPAPTSLLGRLWHRWSAALRSSAGALKEATTPGRVAMLGPGVILVAAWVWSPGTGGGAPERVIAASPQPLDAALIQRLEALDMDVTPIYGSTYIRPGWMTTAEVTVDQYKACQLDHACTPPSWDSCLYADPEQGSDWNTIPQPAAAELMGGDHPVVCITVEQAQRFARWIGGRLPFLSEWRHAATGGLHSEFPWGDKPPYAVVGDKPLANYGSGELKGAAAQLRVRDSEDGYRLTAPVCAASDAESSHGFCDLVGNVSELVLDWYDSKERARGQEAGCEVGDNEDGEHIAVGGSWIDADTGLKLSCSRTVLATKAYGIVGFRVVFEPGEAPRGGPDEE